MPKPSTGPGRTGGSGRSNAARPLGSKPSKVPTQPKSPARIRLERLSAKPLLRLHTLPRIILPIVLTILLVSGLLIPNRFAGLLLAFLGLILLWLVALSWPAIIPSARIIRVLVVAVIFAAALWRLLGNG